MSEKDEKYLYIIAGANGSGKSTLAELLLTEKHLKFLNADDIAKEISPEAIDKAPISAGKIYFKRLNKYFEKQISFAVETTLSGKNIERIINTARKYNYKITLIYIYLSKFTTCIKRVKIRVLNGGHNVPEKDIIRRYYKSIINFWDKYRYLVDNWSLFYNGKNYQPVSVADGKHEICDIIKEEEYKNFVEIYTSAKDEINNV